MRICVNVVCREGDTHGRGDVHWSHNWGLHLHSNRRQPQAASEFASMLYIAASAYMCEHDMVLLPFRRLVLWLVRSHHGQPSSAGWIKISVWFAWPHDQIYFSLRAELSASRSQHRHACCVCVCVCVCVTSCGGAQCGHGTVQPVALRTRCMHSRWL